MKLTPSQFAKVIGVSTRRINTAIHDGLLSESVERKPYGNKTRYFIDQENGKAEWASNIDLSKQRETYKAQQTRALLKDENSNYHRARAIREFYQAKSAELEYLERIGKLLCAKDVQDNSFKIGRRIRDNLFSSVDRMAPEIVAMKNTEEISNYIRREFLVALKELENLTNFKAANL